MRGFLERLRAMFSELAPRERLLVLAAGGMVAAFLVWFALARPVLASLDRTGQRVEAAERELQVASRLENELVEIRSRLDDVERRIREQPAANLFTALEELAKQSGVQVESMEPQAAPSQEKYRETKVQVVLKQVTLAQTVNFLHRIETMPQLLSIKSLRVRTRPDQSQLLDVTFSVSSFETR